MHSPHQSFPRRLASFAHASAHFTIVIGETHLGFEDLECLLGRIWGDGTFELISPGWEILGYRPHELRGRCFCELIPLAPEAAHAAATELLDRDGPALEFPVRHKDGRLLTINWHRHLDEYTNSMFIVGQQSDGAARPPGRRTGAGTGS